MKIGDLGLAKIHESNNSIILTSFAKGTVLYLCPEIIENMGKNDKIPYSKYSDIW